MDPNTVGTPLPQKREQKFLRFKLTPEDVALLDQLPAPQREAILCDGTYQERAAKLNIPVGTVRSRLHRARAALEALRNGQGVIDSRITQLN